MALINKLEAIGDAIREKTGKLTREEIVSENPIVLSWDTAEMNYQDMLAQNLTITEEIEIAGATQLKLKGGNNDTFVDGNIYSYSETGELLHIARIEPWDLSLTDLGLSLGGKYYPHEYIAAIDPPYVTIPTSTGKLKVVVSWSRDCLPGGPIGNPDTDWHRSVVNLTITALDGEGNVITQGESVTVKNKMTLDEMPAEILAIEAGEKDIVLTGDCSGRFKSGQSEWFINEFGDRITTKDLISGSEMFMDSNIEEIPFDLNFTDNDGHVGFNHMFSNCQYLKKAPPAIRGDFSQFFPEGSMDHMFNGCYRLRTLPDFSELVISGLSDSNISNYRYNFYNSLCHSCHTLDEIVGLPVIKDLYGAKNNNCFDFSFVNCHHAKRFTFQTNADGTPIKAINWNFQVIDLCYLGMFRAPYEEDLDYSYYAIEYGLTEDTKVVDDETYHALKDNPDWWTADIAYCRYNHDSAVETINSLPDVSSGGTHIIDFGDGNKGSKTDGGAINTLTEEEIAVATAKGWEVQWS